MKGDQIGGPIRWRMHLRVPPETVFNALTTDDGRARFWAESAVESGGAIRFRFISGVVAECRVLELRAPEVFALEYFDGIARFDLSSDDRGGTDLVLTHTGVPADDWCEVHAGWLNVLFPLKAWLVAGIDLRNHDPRRSWEVGYADQ